MKKQTFAKIILTALISVVIMTIMVAVTALNAKAAASAETTAVRVISLDQQTLDRYAENVVCYYRPSEVESSSSQSAIESTPLDSITITAPQKSSVDEAAVLESDQASMVADVGDEQDDYRGEGLDQLMLSFYLTDADQRICETIEANTVYEAHLRIINTGDTAITGLRVSVRDLSAVIRGSNTTDTDIESGTSTFTPREVPVFYVGRIEGVSRGAALKVKTAEGDLRIDTYEPGSIRLESNYFDGDSDKIRDADLFSHWAGALVGDRDRDGVLRPGDDHAIEVVFKITTGDYIVYREPSADNDTAVLDDTTSVEPDEAIDVLGILQVAAISILSSVIGFCAAFIWQWRKNRFSHTNDAPKR